MMNGSEFLSVAQILINRSEPWCIRSATSRAYYAAYNYAQHVLRFLGFQSAADVKKHHSTWKYFGHATDIELSAAASMAFDLYEERRAADYDMHKTVPEKKSTAGEAMRKARDIIKALKRCETDGDYAGQVRADLDRVIR